MASKKNYYRFPTATPYRSGYHGVDGIFSWTIFIVFLIGFALFCWVGSFYVFGHPEKPTNYRLLQHLHKIEDPQRFEVSTVPRGEFLKPAQLLERFGHLESSSLEQFNATLLRDFLRNYHQTRDLIPYAVGDYKIVALLPLDPQKLFFPGMVALLQSIDQPTIFLEQVLTTDQENLAALQEALTVGEEVKLEKPIDFSAIIFIDPLPHGGIKATIMPLLYGNYGTTGRSSTFKLQPPPKVTISAGLPFFTATETAKFASTSQATSPAPSMKKELLHVAKTTPPATQTSSSHQEETSKSLVSNKTPKVIPATAVNQPSVLPAIAVNTPKKETPVPPAASLPAAPIAAAPAPPPLSQAQNNVSSPILTTSKDSFSTPFTTPGAIPSSTPTTSPPPANTVPGGWPLYEPGQMPRGRLVDAAEIPALAEQGLAGERLYLQGNFIVTASGLDRAVLRYQTAKSDLPLSRLGKIRIIALFPTGSTPPTEGLSLTRDAAHPLMITEVKKDNDGTVNLYVREIVKQ